ncbi:hypothetical protein CJF32_00003772 [Rutstroemia sp. NJR-2017a WRK4]|nr:hypothetical protein CJF32_00003772 [Rutstroemia sp. NJR-2017a WRK4]
MSQSSTPTSNLPLRPDSSPQRGRKRRRSSAVSPPSITTSTSTNFRGRCRQRSLSAQPSASPHPQFNVEGHTPQAKYQKTKINNKNKNTAASPSATLQVYERQEKPESFEVKERRGAGAGGWAEGAGEEET